MTLSWQHLGEVHGYRQHPQQRKSSFMSDEKVTIHTDGACSGNPGPGGWGAVLQYGDTVKELKGGEQLTTNNQMELTAAIEALNALKRPCPVELHTDSNYVKDGLTKWIHGWKKNGWKTRRQEAGQECRAMAGARRRRAAPQHRLALGQGPQRRRDERARRRARQRGHGAVQGRSAAAPISCRRCEASLRREAIVAPRLKSHSIAMRYCLALGLTLLATTACFRAVRRRAPMPVSMPMASRWAT